MGHGDRRKFETLLLRWQDRSSRFHFRHSGSMHFNHSITYFLFFNPSSTMVYNSKLSHHIQIILGYSVPFDSSIHSLIEQSSTVWMVNCHSKMVNCQIWSTVTQIVHVSVPSKKIRVNFMNQSLLKLSYLNRLSCIATRIDTSQSL